MRILAALLVSSAALFGQAIMPGTNATDRINLAANPFTISLPNSATGTTLNKLAKAVTVGGVLQAQIITTSAADQAAVIGCVISGAGTSGSALIVVVGTASCYFDAATTAGHIAVPSSTSAGALHDSGSTSSPASGEVLATVGATNACSSPPCLIAGNLFMTPDLVASGAAGNGGGGGNGSRSFKNITAGTNTTAAMVVDSGATLDVPTQTAGNNTTRAASTAFVSAAVVAAGGFVLIEQHTASNSAELLFPTCFTSTYDSYQIEFVHMLPSVDSTGIQLQFSHDGSTYDATNNYAYADAFWQSNSSTVGYSPNTGANHINIAGPDLSNVAANGGLSGNARIYDPLDAVAQKFIFGHAFTANTGTNWYANYFNGRLSVTTGLTGFRIYPTSGNIVSGTVRVYGLAK